MQPPRGYGGYPGHRNQRPGIHYGPEPRAQFPQYHADSFPYAWNYEAAYHSSVNPFRRPFYADSNHARRYPFSDPSCPGAVPVFTNPYFSHRVPSLRLQYERPAQNTAFRPNFHTRQNFVRRFPPAQTARPYKNRGKPQKTSSSVVHSVKPETSILPHIAPDVKAEDASFASDDANASVLGNPHNFSFDYSDHNLREKLISQLRRGVYQCLICISEVRHVDPIWSCSICFHIYHLSCIKSWSDKCSAANTSETPTESSGAVWRCPACQTKQVSASTAITCFCFCGRVREPKYHPGQTSIPHGCDEVCGKSRSKIQLDETDQYANQMRCIHPCTELCHPGPCPPCISSVSMHCPCGHVQRSSLCGSEPPGPCGHPCGRQLSAAVANESSTSACAAGIHQCLYSCHVGECPPCPWVFQTVCFCARETREIICGSPEARKLVFTPDILSVLTAAAEDFNLSADTEKSLVCGTDPKPALTLDNCKPIAEATPIIANPPTTTDGTPDLAVSDFIPDESTKPPVLLGSPPVVQLPACFSCDRLCDRDLSCGNHKCTELCHAGDCKPCGLDPSRCFTCPCGRVPLSKLVLNGSPTGDRTSCLDPLPSCPNKCGRPHPLCGHPCPLTCHMGPCPPCQLSITANCRCGRATKELTCIRFEELAGSEGLPQMTCERICNKKKVCGRHKCRKKCCDLQYHPCSENCNRRLACQQHNCEDPCHAGPCGSCWRGVIYTELYCRCGNTVLHPPQPCGSLGPECTLPCSRPHGCDHPVRHPCHYEPVCPPCTELLTKECPGGHGVQFSLPCFQPVLSCGRVCDKPLLICSHKCQRLCHLGDCQDWNGTGGDVNTDVPVNCTQPCQKPRPDCGHPCNLPCHEAASLTCEQAAAGEPKAGKELRSSRVGISLPPCQEMIKLVCACGKRKESRPCYQVQASECVLALQEPSEVLKVFSRPAVQNEPLQILACDSACTADQTSDSEMWKRGLAAIATAGQEATDAKTPFELPEYSEFLRTFATKNFQFAESIEKQLYNMLLQFWKPPTSLDGEPPRVLSHHFPPMNKKRRHFICELAEIYGMESYTFDPEPKRHVMVLAKRGCIRFPGGAWDNRGSLTNCLKREGVVVVRPPGAKKSDAIKIPAVAQSVVRSSYASVLQRNNSN